MEGDEALPRKCEEVRPASGEESADAAARLAGFTSGDQLRRAEKVVERGTPELVEALGYLSPDDLIIRGYELEPEEIRLAVRWLELNDPESAVGIKEVLDDCKGRNQKAAQATTGEVLPVDGFVAERSEGAQMKHPESQPVRAKAAGISRSQQQKQDALARKAPALMEAVRRGEISTHRACIQAGIVKEPPPRHHLRKWWKHAGLTQRREFLDEVTPGKE